MHLIIFKNYIIRPLILLLFSIPGFSGFGQTKTLQVPIHWNKDTSSWFKWKMNECNMMGLADLRLSPESLHFRFWTEIQAVDIWTSDFKVFNGLLANFTEKTDIKNGFIDEIKGNIDSIKRNNFFSKKNILDTGIARPVFRIFSDHSILSIPPQDSIIGWRNGNDGEEFFMEYATPSFYSFKEYWTPSAFKEIKEAVLIDKTLRRLDSLLDLQKVWDEFLYSLPKGCYRSGELTYDCNTLTPEQIRKKEKRLERERRKLMNVLEGR